MLTEILIIMFCFQIQHDISIQVYSIKSIHMACGL